MLTNAPLAGGYFVSTLPEGCVKHHRDGNGYSHFVNECDPDRYLSDPDARNVS